jgi:hypothetical protein
MPITDHGIVHYTGDHAVGRELKDGRRRELRSWARLWKTGSPESEPRNECDGFARVSSTYCIGILYG